ncbi:MAG: hypothetical protein J5835_02970 [Bacteroidales bacterium]|nr:hypothetical protein [Bacteroidales bacterium]
MKRLPILLLISLFSVSCNPEAENVDTLPESTFHAVLPQCVKQSWQIGDKVSVISLKDGAIATVDTFTTTDFGSDVAFSGHYTGAQKASITVVYPALENESGQIYESAPLYGNENGFFHAVKGTGYLLFAPSEGMCFLQERNSSSAMAQDLCFMMESTSANLLFGGSITLQARTSILKLELDSSIIGTDEKVQSLTVSISGGTPFTSYGGSMSLGGYMKVWTTNEAKGSFSMSLGDFNPGAKLTAYVPVFPNNSGASLSGNEKRTLTMDVKTGKTLYSASGSIPASDNAFELSPGKEIGLSGTLAVKGEVPEDEKPVKSVTKVLEKGPSALYLDGKILYVGSSSQVLAYDVTTPLKPALIGSVSFTGAIRQMRVYNGKLIASARETGVWVFDVSDPTNMSVITRYDGIELSTGIDVAGDCIFVGERQTGVEFVDARDITKPQHIRVIKTPESQSVFYQDGYLYSGEWAAGQVTIFNAKDLGNIQQVATIKLQGYGDGLWVYGNRLYASTGHHHRNDAPTVVDGDGHGVEIWDITSPEKPSFISRVEFDIFYISGFDSWQVWPSGDGKTLFCADVFNGLYIVDITNERKPEILYHWEPLGNGDTAATKTHYVSHVALTDGYAYVSVSSEGVYAIESSRAKPSKRDRGVSPTNLAARYTYSTPWYSRFNAWVPDKRGAVKGAAVYGDALFVGCGDAGLYTVKMVNNKPQKVGYLDIPFAGGVAIQGNKLYVARGYEGLGVYRIGSDLSLTPIALLKQELNPSKPSSQFSYWVSAPNDKYVVNGCRKDGYQFIAVEGTDAAPKYTFKRQYSLNVNYNRYIAEKTSTEDLLPYATRSGLVWINLSSTASVPSPVVVDSLKNALTEGATLYKNNQILLTRSHTLCTIDPGGSVITKTSEYGESFSGIPRWESGDNVMVCNFVNRYVSKINTANFESPTLVFKEETLGYPEPGIFWNGKCVVPCGYQGLLVEK